MVKKTNKKTDDILFIIIPSLLLYNKVIHRNKSRKSVKSVKSGDTGATFNFMDFINFRLRLPCPVKDEDTEVGKVDFSVRVNVGIRGICPPREEED